MESHSISDTDPLKLQDSIAPQKECNGLLNANGKSNIAGNKLKTGRAFIPNLDTKGFVGSHKIKNYGWIFNKLTSQDNGYIKPR